MKLLATLGTLTLAVLTAALATVHAQKPAPEGASATVYAPWPCDAKEAARRQEETAKVLAVPKDGELALGQGVMMKLVLIPAGKFSMGSPKDEKGRSENEGPQHEVTIRNPFYVGMVPVTQQQYQQVAGKNPSQFKGADKPVEMMSWDDAVAFCAILSKKAGKVVRLPTEAEWEYACRSGSDTSFYFGNDETKLDEYAWDASNSGKATHPVGQKKPNAWGLYDMSGNVWQWCSDWMGTDYYGSSPKEDPPGPASGDYRVLRGGSWPSAAKDCRSAFRSWNVPAHRVGKIGSFGFRVVVEVGKK